MARREQTGTEMLVVYGIMIVVVIVAIALFIALYRFPVGSIPGSCSIYGTLKCGDIAYFATGANTATLEILASLATQGTVNVIGFNAVVEGVDSSQGYCSTTGKEGGPTEVYAGGGIYCIASIPTGVTPGQPYSGTFEIVGTYCASGSCTYNGLQYRFGGSFTTKGEGVMNTLTVTTTSIPQVVAPLSIALSPARASIAVGQAVSFTNVTAGGVPPYSSYSYTLDSPSGWSRNGNRITFTTAGTYNVYESATDSAATTARSGPSQITVVSPTPIESFYVTNRGSSNVVLVDLATKTITNSISGPFSQPDGIAVAPSGAFAYVTNFGSSNVVIIDPSTNRVVGSITGFDEPQYVAIAPSSAYAYVTNGGSSTVSIVSASTNSIVGTVSGSFSNPDGVAFAPSGTYAYIANYNTGVVDIVSTATNTVTGTIQTRAFDDPSSIAFSPTQPYAYVTNEYGGSSTNGNVIIVNTATNTVVGSIGSGFLNADGVAFTLNGTFALITNSAGSQGGTTANIVIVNTATNTVVGSITGGLYESDAIALAP